MAKPSNLLIYSAEADFIPLGVRPRSRETIDFGEQALRVCGELVAGAAALMRDNSRLMQMDQRIRKELAPERRPVNGFSDQELKGLQQSRRNSASQTFIETETSTAELFTRLALDARGAEARERLFRIARKACDSARQFLPRANFRGRKRDDFSKRLTEVQVKLQDFGGSPV